MKISIKKNYLNFIVMQLKNSTNQKIKTEKKEQDINSPSINDEYMAKLVNNSVEAKEVHYKIELKIKNNKTGKLRFFVHHVSKDEYAAGLEELKLDQIIALNEDEKIISVLNFSSRHLDPDDASKAPYKPTHIMLHYTSAVRGSENKETLDDYIKINNSCASAHFYVNKDGEIYNVVPTFSRAYHAGVGLLKQEALLNPQAIKDTTQVKPGDMNSRSIGIEIISMGGNFIGEQVKAVNQLIDWLHSEHIVDPKVVVISHGDWTDRKNEMGPNFPWLEAVPNNLRPNFPSKLENAIKTISQRAEHHGKVIRLNYVPDRAQKDPEYADYELKLRADLYKLGYLKDKEGDLTIPLYNLYSKYHSHMIRLLYTMERQHVTKLNFEEEFSHIEGQWHIYAYDGMPDAFYIEARWDKDISTKIQDHGWKADKEVLRVNNKMHDEYLRYLKITLTKKDGAGLEMKHQMWYPYMDVDRKLSIPLEQKAQVSDNSSVLNEYQKTYYNYYAKSKESAQKQLVIELGLSGDREEARKDLGVLAIYHTINPAIEFYSAHECVAEEMKYHNNFQRLDESEVILSNYQ